MPAQESRHEILDAVGRREALGDVVRNVALLIAELKQIAQRHGINASVLFHCLVNETEQYWSTSFVDTVVERRAAQNCDNTRDSETRALKRCPI